MLEGEKKIRKYAPGTSCRLKEVEDNHKREYHTKFQGDCENSESYVLQWFTRDGGGDTLTNKNCLHKYIPKSLNIDDS